MLRKFFLRFTLKTPSILKIHKSHLYKKYKNCNTKQFSFGNKNNDKIFYVIKRTPGAGFFSNVLFVLNHVKICKKKNYFPIVDMKNFPTIYNESCLVNKTYNSWNYYFKNLSNISLDEVYRSKNVIITSNNFEPDFEKDLISDEIKKIFCNDLKIHRKFQRYIDNYYKINFKNKNILGVHFRGTSYKKSPGHPFPATKKQIFKIIDNIISQEKYEKIFLVTEEENYKTYLIDKFKDKIMFISSSFRSNTNNAFKIYPRQKHRYKLGREALIEAQLLSKCNGLVYVTSNISSAAITWSNNKFYKTYKIDNGKNSTNIFLSQFLWYIKKILPSKFGGFKSGL